MTNIEVVGLGALNIDHIYRVELILEDGETTLDKESISRYGEPERKFLGKFPGGSAANTVYGLARLGVNTGFAGVIGDDADGKTLLTDFQTAGVDTSQIRVKSGAKTGSALCLSDSSGNRSLYVSPEANNLLTISDLDLDYIKQAKILHISSFVDDKQFKVLLELIDRLGASTKVSFAPGALYAAKGLKALAPILKKTHLLFVNEKEMEQLTGKDLQTGAEACLEHGCKIIVVTLGEGTSINKVPATSYIRDSENEHIVAASDKNSTPAIDTTGAGDAFASGFLYGILNGKEPTECGQMGDITARFSISQIGARQGLPAPSELSQRYRELYDREL